LIPLPYKKNLTSTRFRDHEIFWFSFSTTSVIVWFKMVAKKSADFYVEPYLEKFENFLSYMKDRPEGMSLHLIDSSKGFKRGNIKWAPGRNCKPRSCTIRGRKREHNSWKNAKMRCYYPSHAAYKRYQEIGCYMEDWLKDFENFYSYMGQCPEGMSLDRIDCYGPYVRGNIRWATIAQQNTNKKCHAKKTSQLSIGLFLVDPPDGEKAA